MSEAGSREARRNVRRTVGAEAVDLLDQHTQALTHRVIPKIEAAAVELQHVNRRLEDLSRRVTDLANEQRSYVDAEDRELRRELRALSQRSSWRRLFWLVRGI